MARPCVFCAIAAGSAPASVVWEDDAFLAFLDIHPMRPGHTLVVPRQHARRIADLSEEHCGRLFAIGRRLGDAMRAGGCDDVNFLLNDGPAANQTVPHVHLHVVPRRRGDLGRLLRNAILHPFPFLLRATPRGRLDDTAADLRRALGQTSS